MKPTNRPDLNTDPKNHTDFMKSLEMLRDFRKWAHENHVNPYVVRQALVWALEIDRRVAIETGVPEADLEVWDSEARHSIPEEAFE